MAIEPSIPTVKKPTQVCPNCKKSTSNFAFTHSIFYPTHLLPICNECIGRSIAAHHNDWEWIDKVCRWADFPFVVKEWTRISDLNKSDPTATWTSYSNIFKTSEYESLGWADYNSQYRRLKEVGLIESELPLIDDAHYSDLKRKWGGNYSPEELDYLEDLYKGILTSQNVSGALQVDQAQKLCKLSLEIDTRIRAGDKDVDKFIASYDKLIKTAEFTPKNTKNAADFDSFAEIALWLEKRGFVNKFYDNVTRDVIDELLKNIENYNQKLYINEGGIGDAITERIEALKYSEAQTSTYDIQSNFSEDEYDNYGYTFAGDNDDFNATAADNIPII